MSLVILEKLRSLLEESKRMDPSIRYGAFGAAKAIVLSLQRDADRNEMDGYTLEKLSVLDWHIGAMFGMDDDNGHSTDQHQIWALEAIGSLRSDQCFRRDE
jgi:hypothetical protein